MSTKEEHRQQIRRALAQLSPEERTRASVQITARMIELPEFKSARAVALYAAMRTEPSTRALFDAARGAVAFPYFNPTTSRLDLRVADEWDKLIPGAFGVLEPDPAQCPLLPVEELGAVVIPGMAFDRLGTRLGRGGGYYDRLLATLPQRITRVGCFFAVQEMPELPREPHDHPLNVIVTEKETIRSWN